MPGGDWLSRYADPPEPPPGGFDRFMDWASRGYADPAASRLATSMTNPTMDRGWLESTVRGFLGGALEGASRTFTSPLGIATTALSGIPGVGALKALPAGLRAIGGGLSGIADAAGMTRLAQTANLANTALGLPSLVHGGGEVFEGAQSGDLGQMGQGFVETGLGALGTVAPFLHAKPVAPPTLRPRNSTPPPVKLGLPTDPITPGFQTPDDSLARKAAYFARTGRTVPPPAGGALPPPGRNINAPLREGNVEDLLALLRGPEPLDPFSVEPSVPLQDWNPPAAVEPGPPPAVAAGQHLEDWNPVPGSAGYNPRRFNAPPERGESFDMLPRPSVPLQDWIARRADPEPFEVGPGPGFNPRRMNEPPPQMSPTALLESHFFPNGRATVPEQQVVPGAPWQNEPTSTVPPPFRPFGGPDAAPRRMSRGELGLEPSQERLTPAGGDDDLEALGAIDRQSNLAFLERFLKPFQQSTFREPEPQWTRLESPRGDVAPPSVPEAVPPTTPALPAPTAEFSDPDLISRLFAYGPSRTYESILSGGEPYFSPEILSELGTQPGGFARPEPDILEAAKQLAKGYVAPNERDLPWRQRLEMRSNEERYQHAINEPDRPSGSLAALEQMAAPQASTGLDANALEAELRNRTRTWQDFSRDEKLAVEGARRAESEANRAARQAEEEQQTAALIASLPRRFSDATPDEQRELRRMLAELREFPFQGRNFYRPPEGGLEVTGNTPGAPIFHDIMGGRGGSRRSAIRALEAFIEQGKPATKISQRAAHVARRAAEGDQTIGRRMLPPDAGELPPPPDPDVDFPFGENDPTGESGFVNIDPAAWKMAGRRASKALEALDYFSMLSGPLTHLKNVGGNLGAVVLEAARRGIRGDVGTAGRILGETFSPQWLSDLRIGYQHPEAGTWTPDTSRDYTARSGILSVPSKLAGAPDYATRQALKRAGLGEEEARHVTYTGEPRSQSGQAFVGGIRKAGAVGRFVSPFPRIATNLLETGIEHTPVLGSIAEAISGGKLQSGWDKQALGALAALAGGLMGPASDVLGKTWGPVAQAALGPVNIPYTAGATIGSALEAGDSLPNAGRKAWNTFSESTPIPTYISGPADWFARKVPNLFPQLGLVDPTSMSDAANDWWPIGKALSRIPVIGERLLLGANPAPQNDWLSRYADR